MAVYSTRKFFAMIAASLLVGVLVVSTFSIVLPSFAAAPAFRAVPRVSSPVISAGSTSKLSLDLKSLNGFSGLVNLAVAVTNAPSGLQAAVFPASLTLSPSETATVTLNVTSTATTPPGDYSIILKETSASFSNTDTVSVKVASLAITANLASLSFAAGASGSSSITITSVNGVSGNVVLVSSTSAAGPTARTTPNSFYLASSGTVSSILTVNSAAQGVFDVTVTAIGGGGQFYQSVTLPVTVSPSSPQSGDFNITLIPNSLSIARGSSENVVVNLGSLNGCLCLVTLSTSTPAVGLGIGVTPYIVQLTASGTADSTLFINADPTATVGTYTVTVTGTSLTLTHSAKLSFTISSGPVPDFAISVNPISFIVVNGSSSTTQVTVQSLGGFTGTVNLTTGIIPSVTNGPTATVGPSSLVLSAGSVSTSTLTISTASNTPALAGYNFTVTATSGTTLHSAIGFFTIIQGATITHLPGDFDVVCCYPTGGGTISVAQGSTYHSYAWVDSLNNFTGTVTLTLNLPLQSSVSPTNIILKANTTVTPNISVSAPSNIAAGTYYGSLNGTSVSKTHYALLKVQVTSPMPDFSVSASPVSLTIQQGSSNSSTITVTSLNGLSTNQACPNYWQVLKVSAQESPQTASSPTVSFNQSCLTLKASGTNGTLMTIATSSGTVLGLYVISVSVCYQISASGPSLCNGVTVYAQVSGPQAGILGTSLSPFNSIPGTMTSTKISAMLKGVTGKR